MSIIKKVSLICSIALIAAIGGYGIYEWFVKNELNPSTIFFLLLVVGFLFQSITWGEMRGKNERDKDELEKHITLVSSKINYYILLILMVVVLFLSEGLKPLDEINNTPLVVVIGLAFATYPITEFFVAKKYQ